MNNPEKKSVRIVGVPLDLGASRRGTDMGPFWRKNVRHSQPLQRNRFFEGTA